MRDCSQEPLQITNSQHGTKPSEKPTDAKSDETLMKPEDFNILDARHERLRSSFDETRHVMGTTCGTDVAQKARGSSLRSFGRTVLALLAVVHLVVPRFTRFTRFLRLPFLDLTFLDPK